MRTRMLALLAALIALAALASPALAAPKKATVKFSSAAYSVAENAGMFNLIVQRSGNTQSTVSANLAITGASTATGGGVDYTYTGPSSVTFTPGQTSRTIPVTIVDNALASTPNKRIVFALSGATPAGTKVLNSPTAVTIIDDEGPGQIDFSTNAYTALESGGLATITVTRTAAPNLVESVDYATSNGTATTAAPTPDYTAAGGTVTFAVGEMSKTFQVPITDDSNAETPETVNLTLSNAKNLTAGAAPTIGSNNPATLTINDDDVSIFSFASTLFSAGESAGTATITVNRSGATNIAASVDYSTPATGTATVNSDYTAASGTLNFAAGETQKTFNVPILGDGADEPNETVDLALSNGATAELSIVDDDFPTESVQFSNTAYTVNEADGTATILVQLSHALTIPTSVHYATADGTAADGSDYTGTSGTLNFAAGDTEEPITVPILNPPTPDPEDDETVTLTLSTPGVSLVLGDPATATLTIADDDPPGTIDFKSLTYSATEAGGVATVTVQRVAGTGGAVSVDYGTSDGSATAGSDYTAASGTLNWAAGDGTDKTFSVPITWDGRGEGPEAINLELANAAGADLGPNTAAVIQIADDGASGPIRLSAGSYNVNEAGGSVTITVTRSGGSLGGPVSVDYATANGTATAGSDYTATSGTITFGPGETTKTFTVAVANDAVHEDGETFQVTLSGAAGGATIGSPSSATVTIADDDPAAGAPAPVPTVAAAADTRAPMFRLTAKKVQKALKAKLITLKATCDEDCTLTVVAKVGKGRKKVTLGRAKVSATTGKKAAIKVKLSTKALANLTKALKGGKARIALTVVAADGAGNKRKAARALTVQL